MNLTTGGLMIGGTIGLTYQIILSFKREWDRLYSSKKYKVYPKKESLEENIKDVPSSNKTNRILIKKYPSSKFYDEPYNLN